MKRHIIIAVGARLRAVYKLYDGSTQYDNISDVGQLLVDTNLLYNIRELLLLFSVLFLAYFKRAGRIQIDRNNIIMTHYCYHLVAVHQLQTAQVCDL